MRSLALAAGLLAAAFTCTPSMAQEKIKVAYIASNTYIPFVHALKAGYFKAEGLDPEAVMVNSGPAEISAVLSGSADVAMVATIPLINARAQGQPLRAFMTYNMEGPPGPMLNHMVASGRSGVKTIQDVKGKTVASNAAGGGCDLAIRDQLLANKIPLDQVKIVVIPFPQMQAALEIGTIDVACVVDPFFTSMMDSQKLKAVDIALGMIANLDKIGMYAQDGYLATEDWLAKNPKTAAAFIRVIQKAARDLNGNKDLFRQYLLSEFKMPLDVTKSMVLDLNTEHMEAEPKFYQPAVDAMSRTGMLTKSIKAEDLVVTIKP